MTNTRNNPLMSICYRRAGGHKAYYELPKEEQLRLQTEVRSELAVKLMKASGNWIERTRPTVLMANCSND